MTQVLPSAPSFPELSLAERDRRWGLAQELMETRDLDALLVYGDKGDGTGQPFVGPDTWFTNDRPGSIVVMPCGGEPRALTMLHIAVGAHAEAARRGDTNWIAPENLYAGGTSTTAGGGRTSTAIAEVLEALDLTRSRIGLIGLEPFGAMAPEGVVPHGTAEGLREACPDLRYERIGHDWLNVMLPKSAEELALLEVSCRAGEHMCEVILDTTRPGASENEIYGAAMEACFAAGATTHWLILVRARAGESVGWGPPAWTFRAQSPERIEAGDTVLVELFPSYGMLDAQQQLTVVVGEPHPQVEKAGKVARDAYDAGLAAMRPGARFGDVADSMRTVVEAAGGWQLTPHVHLLNPNAAVSGCGFPPGLDEVAAYGNRGELKTFGADLRLAAGMTFAMQANCSLGRHRVNVGGTVVLEDTRVRELNELPNTVRHVG